MNKVLGSLFRVNPSFFTAGVVLSTITATTIIIHIGSIIDNYEAIILFSILFVLFSMSILSILGHVARIEKTMFFLTKLSLLYLEIIILFTVAYYWMILIPWEPPISGISPLWLWGALEEGRSIQVNTIFLTIIDLFHFSVVTMTTLGYGDMTPNTWYAKLAVDAQVLLGMGVLVIGIGKYFSQVNAQQNSTAMQKKTAPLI